MITIVGAGFLGGLFAEEWGKRLFAYERSGPVSVIDFDRVEDRNAANQVFTVKDGEQGVFKSEAVRDRLLKYNVEVPHLRPTKLDKSNIDTLLHGTTLIVSAVDNLPTRQLLWYYGKAKDVPVLHLGVSQGGTGNVDWTYGKTDTWSLSPIALLGQGRRLSFEKSTETLPPCELVAFRGLGLNTALAGAKAAGIYHGWDAENVLSEQVMPGTMTVWTSTNTSHALVSVHQEDE